MSYPFFTLSVINALFFIHNWNLVQLSFSFHCNFYSKVIPTKFCFCLQLWWWGMCVEICCDLMTVNYISEDQYSHHTQIVSNSQIGWWPQVQCWDWYQTIITVGYVNLQIHYMYSPMSNWLIECYLKPLWPYSIGFLWVIVDEWHLDGMENPCWMYLQGSFYVCAQPMRDGVTV